VVWTTEARTAKHEFACHRWILERELLCHKTTKRSADDVRTLDADRLQEMRDIVGEQRDRLRPLRLFGSRNAPRIEDDDAEVARKFGSLLEPDPTTGSKPRNQHNRRAITFDLVIELQTVNRYFGHDEEFRVQALACPTSTSSSLKAEL